MHREPRIHALTSLMDAQQAHICRKAQWMLNDLTAMAVDIEYDVYCLVEATGQASSGRTTNPGKHFRSSLRSSLSGDSELQPTVLCMIYTQADSFEREA